MPAGVQQALDAAVNARLMGSLPSVGVCVHRPGLEEVFDAIVCDPPYGVRAGGRKSVAKPEIEVRYPETHIPSTDPYSMGECLRDLLDLAARTLRIGGRWAVT
jgi:tRNA G10  N-methylase Trm11